MPRKFFGGPRAVNATSTNASGQPPVVRAGLGSQAAQNVRRVPRAVPKPSRVR
jgi:hypothetical protein